MQNSEVPIGKDWDLDVERTTDVSYVDYDWARNKFVGLTREEMIQYFFESPLGAAEALQYMPAPPFQYYVMNYKTIFVEQPIPDWWWREASSAASSFLELVSFTLKYHPKRILPVMEDLMPVVEHVARNQQLYDADPEIWGAFPELLLEIKRLYDDTLRGPSE